MADIRLHVCTSCRKIGGMGDSETRDGTRLFEALSRIELPENVVLHPVECLSNCDAGCNLALSSPSRWSYVYGKMDPDHHIAEILEGVKAYAATKDGFVPWRDRPQIFRKQSVARIPPME